MSLLKKISLVVCISLLAVLVYLSYRSNPIIFKKYDYSFLVAGHAYGSQKGTNIGIYPKFIHNVSYYDNHDADFVVLTGDIVRTSSPEAWHKAKEQLQTLNIPFYYVLGNHDSPSPGPEQVIELFGNRHYAFTHGQETFIVLDTQKVWGNIPKDQIQLIEKTLEQNSSQTVFIFIHELLWTEGQEKYVHVKHNMGSYSHRFQSNYWQALHPIFTKHSDKRFIVFAGDVAAKPAAISAFYEKLDNVELIASGMGGFRDENYLKVSVSKDHIRYDLIPLNFWNTLRSLKAYSL